MNPRISLILATIGRKEEVINFFESLCGNLRFVSRDSFEVIVLDQNNVDFGLLDVCHSYAKRINIKYILSNEVGLSKNRNLGLSISTGILIAFPDDDCTYYDNTLINVFNAFDGDNCTDIFLGRIYDRRLGLNVIKNWPSTDKLISNFSYYLYASSITIFAKKTGIFFDELLGAGAQYGSCEDPDFLYKHLKSGFRLKYSPKIEVNHPIPSSLSFNLDKVHNYASGFGYMVRKNFDIYNFFLLILIFSIKPFQVLIRNKQYSKGYLSSFYDGLILGLLNRKTKV